ncbi:MAG TPA: M24 family metallopeptidase, partial [Chloroflexota bacterium]
ENVRSVGAYDEVIGYVQDVGPPLRQILERIDPSQVAVSYSEDDESSDNITHGMYLMLLRLLQNTPYLDRLEPADSVLMPLRARKSSEEVERIRSSISATLELFAQIEGLLVPGVTEVEVFEQVHRLIQAAELDFAWDPRYDPVVNFGPESAFGHAGAGTNELARGMIVHVDLGVKLRDYCSDLQRCWYLLREDESAPPSELTSAFNAVRASIEAGFEALRPGVPGHVVDAAARGALVKAGYNEPEFAFGHQLGQSAHDGGTLLGPHWPRYGRRPDLPIEEGSVFTLEFAVRTSAGPIGLEEDVLVTADGAGYLSSPQVDLWCLRR